MTDAFEDLQTEVGRGEAIKEGIIRFKQVESDVTHLFWEAGKILYVMEQNGANLPLIWEKEGFKTSYGQATEYKRLFQQYLLDNLDREELLMKATEPPKEISDLGPEKLMELLQVRREHRDEFVESLKKPLNEATIGEIKKKREEYQLWKERSDRGSSRDGGHSQLSKAYRLFDELESSLDQCSVLSDNIFETFMEEFRSYSRRDKMRIMLERTKRVFE